MVHPRNKTKTDPVYFYKPDKHHKYFRSDHYPDFHDSAHEIVLDAKYKFDNGIERNDLLQMVSYLHVLEYRTGVFLKPASDATAYREDGTLATSRGETIGVAKLKIPKVDKAGDYRDFARLLSDEEKLFHKELMRCIADNDTKA